MSTRYPRMIDGHYVSNLPVDRINYIDSIRNSNEIGNLRRMIFNFPKELVMRSIDEGVSIREICKTEDLDWKQHLGMLRPYQTLMTAFMYMSPRSINGDYVGLGKTAEVSALINYLKKRGEMTRFCIAVDSSAFIQTSCELMKFTGLKTVELPGETSKLKKIIASTDWSKTDGIVCKHSVLKNDYFMKFISSNIMDNGTNGVFNVLFIDESSVLKNKNTKICEYTSQIIKITPRVHFMNATPFDTSIMDVYNQLDILDINLLPSKSSIENKYSVWKRGSYWKTENGAPKRHDKFERVGYKNQAEFKEALRYVYFGRSKKDVGFDIPHNYRTLLVKPSKDQKVCIANGYRYQEVLNCPSLIPDINIETNRKKVPKIDLLCRIIEEQYTEDKVMVYVWNPTAQKAICDELKKIGRNPVTVSGGMKDIDRWQIQEDFNKDGGKYDVLITNTRKSLNLYSAGVCILYSLESSSGLYTQICGRIDRNVDDRAREFTLLVYEDSPEYDYLTSKIKKRSEDSRALTLDAKAAIDYFLENLEGEQ